MPAQPTRRAEKKEEDLLTKMSRGEIACAECRRLKLKCDKKIPCSSCTRRGCPSICPTGALSPGQGSRFVLADTPQLHDKVGKMSERIRQLEDALALLQASISGENHPLLSDELMTIKAGFPNVPSASSLPQDLTSKNSATLDSLGTLTIGDKGQSKYFGISAGSEALYLTGAAEVASSSSVTSDLTKTNLPPELTKLADAFPFGSTVLSDEKYCAIVFNQLPDRLRASSLCELYYEQYAFSQQPLKRDELIDDYFTPVYKYRDATKLNPDTHLKPAEFGLTPHMVSVLFAIFAIGTCVDLTNENYTIEAETYYTLSRAALSLQSVFDSPEISTIQSLVLLATYNECRAANTTIDTSWGLISLASKLAQSLGLHRDSARWKLDPKTVERRRHLFWELYMIELFYSLNLGRPPSLRPAHVDAEIPADTSSVVDATGEPLVGFYRWKHELLRDVYAHIADQLLTAVPPKYSVILELDGKLRAKPLPAHLCKFMDLKDPTIEDVSISEHFSSVILGLYRAVVLIQLHRSYFAQALLDHPSNPLRSPFAPSVLAVYRAASWIIKGQGYNLTRFSKLMTRVWHPWTHLFSSAMIMGSIVINSPKNPLAENAFSELQLACSFYEIGVKGSNSKRNASGWKILERMRARAQEVFAQRDAPSDLGQSLDLQSPRPDDDELKIFGGQARVVIAKVLSDPRMTRKSELLENSQASTPTIINYPGDMSMEAHPLLAAYLGSTPFQGLQGTSNDHNLEDPMVIDLNLSLSGPDTPPDFRLNTNGIDPNQEWFQQVPVSEFDTSTNWLALQTGWQGGFNSLGDVMHKASPPQYGNESVDPLFAQPATVGRAGVDDQWQAFLHQSGLVV